MKAIHLILAWWACRRGEDIYWFRGRAFFARDFSEGDFLHMSIEEHQRIWTQRDR